MTYRRDEGTEIEVEWTVEQYGSPASWTDPGDPTIIAITEVFDMAGNAVELTEAETERLEIEIAEEVDNEPSAPEYYD